MSIIDRQRVAVIGGGIVGLWAALNLIERGLDVVVVERGELGEGSTAAATGGIRCQFSTPTNIDLSVRAVRHWERFEQRTGSPLAFRHHGFLFLHDDPTVMASFEPGLERLRRHGMPAEILGPEAVTRVFPAVRTDDLVGGTYTSRDGSASPADGVLGLAGALRRHGAELRRHTTATEVLTSGTGAVRAVRTDQGDVDADHVVIATGPQARALGRRCGLEIPVAPRSRQAFAARAGTALSPDLPYTIDIATGAYVHPETDGSGIIGGNDRDVPDSETARLDWDRLEPLAEALAHRFPGLDDLEVGKGWAGLREMTRDDTPVIGPAPDVPGLWLSVGFSGHGFNQSPAAGELVADLVGGDGPPDWVDLAALDLGRFAGDPDPSVREAAVF